MRKSVTVLVVGGGFLLALLCAVLYLRFGGVTHERLYDAVVNESDEIQERIDVRCRELDRKLDRIEGKLDKILEMANRPLPDNLQPAR